MSDKLTMDVHRLLTMCNYYRAITKDDKDFLALLAERLERYDSEIYAVRFDLAKTRKQRDTLAEALDYIAHCGLSARHLEDHAKEILAAVKGGEA
jgi:hypothetical protein